jgi:uncharacterized protein (UPF0333 family)
MPKFLKEKKAQGALEYLLIIGGAIILAAIVIAVVINVSKNSKKDVNSQTDKYTDATNVDVNEVAKLD